MRAGGGLTRALVACLEAIDSGPLDRQVLLARYPQFATELARFLDDQEQVDPSLRRRGVWLVARLRRRWGTKSLQQHLPIAMTLGDFRIIREMAAAAWAWCTRRSRCRWAGAWR